MSCWLFLLRIESIVKRRALTYLTFLLTALLPVMAIAWGRSHLRNDTLFRTGGGRAIALDCISGEISLWIAPSLNTGPARYRHETGDSENGIAAAEVFALVPEARASWFLGFGFATAPWMPGGTAANDKMRCFVIPLWFVTLLIGILPAVSILRFIRAHHARLPEPTTLCRRCGAHLTPGEARCGLCSFPVFVRNEVVA